MSKNKNKRGRDKAYPVWDALMGLSAAVGQVTNITASLIPFLQDQALLDKISDRALFNRLGAALNRDVRDMTDRFRAIYNQHSDRRGQSADPTEVMRSIDIHQQYVEWAARFDDVVIPTFMDMVTMLREAGADTRGINVPSASSLTVLQDN